jgi:hypothetical protein
MGLILKQLIEITHKGSLGLPFKGLVDSVHGVLKAIQMRYFFLSLSPIKQIT